MSYLNLNSDDPSASAALHHYRLYDTDYSERCAVCMWRSAYVRPAECGQTGLLTSVTGNFQKNIIFFIKSILLTLISYIIDNIHPGTVAVPVTNSSDRLKRRVESRDLRSFSEIRKSSENFEKHFQALSRL
jgi:hypothetical protein